MTGSAGTIINVDGLVNNAIEIDSAGTVQGQGSVGGVSLIGAGKLAPGLSASATANGTLTASGTVSFDAAGTASLSIRLGQTTAGGVDTLAIASTGTIGNLNNTTLSISTGTAYVSPSIGSVFVIIDGSAVAGTGLIQGQFAQGANIGVGTDIFNILYNVDATGLNPGPDVVLLAVPEPSTWALMIGGIGMLALTQRLRRRLS